MSEETLVELRSVVKRLQAHEGSVPFQDLVALGSQQALREERVTLDLAATEDLGAPLVILHDSSTTPHIEGLTPRETEVATLVAQGLSNKEIADRLFISVPTVKDHVHNILTKTGLASRSAIAARSRRP